MNNQIYLDYNATSPLSKSVKEFLAQGDFSFANPSSTHSLGKLARKSVNRTRRFLYDLFSLSESEHKLFFHSGATEGIRSFFETANAGDGYIYSQADHPVAHAMAKLLSERGCVVALLAVDQDGALDLQGSLATIQKLRTSLKKDAKIFINFTPLNSETGVLWPMELALELKHQTGAYVHVDATQVPGRVPNWDTIEKELDGITFSGHKFGAIKGIGFTFLRNGFPFKSLLVGGNQQDSLRSGTENTLGVSAMELALTDLRHLDIGKISGLRDRIESALLSNDNIQIVGAGAKYGRAANTCAFIHKKIKADVLQMHFDLAGLALSPGSACSSGSLNPSNSLVAMGLDQYALNLLRLSLGPENLDNEEEILRRIQGLVSSL